MICNIAGQSLELERFPYPGSREHRAWDAADEIFFDTPSFLHWSTQEAPNGTHLSGRNILMFDDDHGSLALILAGYLPSCRIDLVSDSLLTHRALEHNAPGDGRIERITPMPLREAIKLGKTLSEPSKAHPHPPGYEGVVMKLPKSALMFENYCRIILRLAPRADIWIGGMSKRWSPALRRMEEIYFGTGNAGKFRRRGRWVYHPPAAPHSGAASRSTSIPSSRADSIAASGTAPHSGASISSNENSPQPESSWTREYMFNSRRYVQTAGIYSSGSADTGTMVLLSQLLSGGGYRDRAGRSLAEQPRAADLGCGNGILGIEFQLTNPRWNMIFCDESYCAVESARQNWDRLSAPSGASAAQFHCMPALEQIAAESLDLVLCNPPFHYKSIQTQEVARHMFQDARRALRPGAELWVVANSHLGYGRFLRSLFDRVVVEQVTEGFKIFRCVKSPASGPQIREDGHGLLLR